MATESIVADLAVILTAKIDAAVASFTEVGASGEEMAAKVTEATASVTAETEKLTASLATAGSAAESAAAAVTASSSTIDDSATIAAGKLEQIGIAAETAATENKLAMAAMSDQTAALTAKLELAAQKAAASNEGISASYAKADAAAAESSKGQAKSFGLAAGAIAGVGVIAVDMAGKYEASTNRLVTSAGESDQAINQVRQGMLDMAGQVGVSAENLATGMYTVESAGYHGADGLTVLKAAAQGAQEENASLTTVADAVSTALTDYHLPASQAAKVTSELITAVGQGKTTMEDFSGALHSITPLAADMHLSLADVTGTLAEMTDHGMSADQASQNLAMTLRTLQKPSQQATQALAQIGMTVNGLQDSLSTKGLQGTLEQISEAILQKMGPSGKVLLNAFNTSKQAAANLQEALKAAPPAVAKLGQAMADGSMTVADYRSAIKSLPVAQQSMATGFLSMINQAHGFTNTIKAGGPQALTYSQMLQAVTGNATTLNTALMVTGENSAGAQLNIAKVAGAATEAGNNVKGWHDIQQTFNQKLSETKASLGALVINLGNLLLPVIKPVVSAFADFTGWLERNHTAAAVIGIALGALAIGLTAAAIAAWDFDASLLANPITWIVVFIVGLIAAIVLLITHWKQVWHAIGDALHSVYTAVIKPVIDAIVAGAKAVAAGFTWLWQNVLKPIFDVLSFAVRAVALVIADVFIAPTIILVKLLAAGISWLWDHAFKPALDAIGRNLQGLYDDVIKPVGAAIGVAIHAIGDVAAWLYNNAIKPVVDALGAAWGWLYRNIFKPFGEGIQIDIKAIGTAASWVWDNVLKPVIDALGAAWHWVYDNAIKPVADFIGSAIHGVGQAFSDAFNWVKSIVQDVWNFIKPIFDAIGNAIGGVSNALGGIGNMVSSTFGGIAHFLGFDDGGFVPGAPGQPMLAVVHGGEYVVSNAMQNGSQPIDPKLGAQLTSSGGAPSLSAGLTGGGSGNTVVQIVVQGNAVTERQLIDVVQQGMLRAGQHRPVTYQNYRR